MNPTSPLFPLLIKYKAGLVSRDFIIDYFGDAQLMSEEEVIKMKIVRPGKLFIRNGKPYVVTQAESNHQIHSADQLNLPQHYKLNFYDRFTLENGMIENYTGKGVETTLGVFLLNYVALVKAFNNAIPYTNGQWDIDKIEDDIAEVVISGKVEPQQALDYITYVYSLSSLNDLCVPALSVKGITANPEVNALRTTLFTEYKDRLNDPNVMMLIEDKLISLDKELLKGDVSNGFMIDSKNYNVHRKRMFLTLGLVESFGDAETTFNFVKTNLNDGWDTKELDVLANDIRRGSYDRAKSTALGGAESKMLGRNFQDSEIVADDCGTHRGLLVDLNTHNSKKFLYRNIIVGDELVALTPDNIGKYIDKQVLLRSPMYCQSKDGYCYNCMDTRFKNIGIKLLNIYPIGIGSALVSASLKSMHGRKLTLLSISDLNQMLV